MKKYSALIILLVLSCLHLFAQSNTNNDPVLVDKVAAVVGDKIILKSDIDNTIADMQRQGVDIPQGAGCAIISQQMGVKALVLQAERDSLPVSDDDVDADLDNQI